MSCTNFISRQVKLSLQEKLKAAVLGRGGKMKICPYSPRPSPQPVGKERDWSWPALPQFPAALAGLWSASFPRTGRICWLCCCNSRYIAKGCCAVQSFALLPTSAMLLPSFGLHPDICLLRLCLGLAMECCKINMLIAMTALLFLRMIFITQPKGGGVGWDCCLV